MLRSTIQQIFFILISKPVYPGAFTDAFVCLDSYFPAFRLLANSRPFTLRLTLHRLPLFFMTALQSILATYRGTAKSEKEKGSYFEELIRTYFRYEATYASLYSEVDKAP